MYEEERAYIVGLLPVQEVPKIDHDGNADCQDGKDTVDFGRPGTSHEKASSKHPSPPVERELTVESHKCSR